MLSQIKRHVLTEISFIEFTLPPYLFSSIQDEILEIESSNFSNARPYNNLLAGALQHEYNLTKCISDIEIFFKRFFEQEQLRRNDGTTIHLCKDNEAGEPAVWVNFQKKYEFNPPHTHSGEYSFVTWVRIPYNLEDERKLAMMKNGNADNSSSFMFTFPQFAPNRFSKGHIDHYTIRVDKSYIGRCILFPSHLHHSVSPFYTSDDYRISVSGNLYFK